MLEKVSHRTLRVLLGSGSKTPAVRDPHPCHDRERRSECEKSTEKDKRPEKKHLNGLKMPDPSRDRSRDGATGDSQSAMQQPFQRRFPKYGFNPKQFDNAKDAANLFVRSLVTLVLDFSIISVSCPQK